MKKLIVISLVMIMLLASAVPAFAAGGPPAERGNASGNGSRNQVGFGIQAPYALSGVISGIDPSSRTVTVTIACGNRLVKQYIGLDVNLATTDATRLLLRNPDGTATPITFEALEVGQNVSSHGIFSDGTWTATRVTIGAILSCLP